MNATVAEKVCTIREQLAERIGSEKFQTWFGESTRFDLELDRLNISVRNQFIGDWIQSHYLPELTEATREVVGSPIKVNVRVSERCDNAQQPSTAAPDGAVTAGRNGQQRSASAAPGARRLRGELGAFVVGPSNALAFAAASTVVKSLAEAFKPLVIHGGCGLGKTHLLQGIFNAVARMHPALVQRYVSGEEFTNEFIYAVKGGRVDGFRARFRNVDLLLIDDIHFLANKKATQEEFLHTFNAIDTCGKQVVLSSDAHPRSIAALSEPLTNRFIAGMVVKLGPPDFKTRREILQRRAAQVRCDVPDEVIDFVAQHVTSNVRELEGSLYKLVALASLNKDPITLDLARAALEEQLIRSQKPTDAAEIERTVAARFGCSREMIHSSMRSRTISLARAIAMHLIRKHTHMSFPEIGRMMGNKNHSTVLMANRRIDTILAEKGMVSWTTSSGTEETALGGLLENIERSFTRRSD